MPETQSSGWQPIETAPRDGTIIWVYAAAAHGLPDFQSPCAWHPDAGFCADELRTVTHWRHIEDVWLPPPSGDSELQKRARAVVDARYSKGNDWKILDQRIGELADLVGGGEA